MHALFALAVACGRLGFDEVAYDAGAAPGDAGDARADGGIDVRRDAGCALGPWSIRELTELNTSGTDWGGEISLDGLTYFFASNGRTGSRDFDVFVASRRDRTAPFGPVSPISGVNTVGVHEGDVTVSDDLSELYFMRSGRITRATRDPDGAYTEDGSLDALVVTDTYLAGPFLAMGGLVLYFSRHTCDAECSVDLSAHVEISTRASLNDDFERYAPVALEGPLMVGYPALSADGLTIFVEGRTAVGEPTDTYQATRASLADPWGPLRPMPEISTPGEESDPSITADGLEIFYATATADGDDLFVAARSCL